MLVKGLGSGVRGQGGRGPAHHNVVSSKINDPARVRHITRVACCQCSRCTDLCPRYLLGHSLEPHKIMRQLGSQSSLSREIMEDALICSECGICEKYACPMMISPREVNAQIKGELLAQGVKRSPKREAYKPSAFRDMRKIPTGRLMERLQMEGITLVMIEHRLRELFRVANRVMVLNFGEKLIEGSSEEVMADERVKEAYFGSEKVEELAGYA